MNSKRELIKYCMLIVNISATLFILIIVHKTSVMICMYSKAFEFLDSVEHVPKNPENSLLVAFFLCFALILVFLLRQFFINNNIFFIYITIFADLIISTWLLTLVNFNYNGLLLWIIASMVHYIEQKHKYIIISLGVLLYMFTNFGVLNVYVPLYSIESYILFYGKDVQSFLFFMHYALNALNLVIFIIFIIDSLQQKQLLIDQERALSKDLAKANQELKKFADVKEKMGQTKERNRLAREIHDTVGHSLMGICVGLDACLALIDTNPAIVKNQLKNISIVAHEGMQDIRQSVSSLKADEINHFHFIENVKHMIDKTVKATQVAIDFENNQKLMLEKYKAEALYRLIQESITNAIRHGKATHIKIRILLQKLKLKITIKDNGLGCKEIKKGFGIKHMTERINMLEGNVQFHSLDGFKVVAVIPVLAKEIDYDKDNDC